MPEFSKAEEGLRKYSAVGQVGEDQGWGGFRALLRQHNCMKSYRWSWLESMWQVLTSVAVHAISSLPFGAPVGALLGAVFSRAAQVWTLPKVWKLLIWKGLLMQSFYSDNYL